MTPDVSTILQSIDDKMSMQVQLLRDLKEANADARRAQQYASVRAKSTLSGAGDLLAGGGKAAEGAGAGIGSILSGFGSSLAGGGLGLAAIMVAAGLMDANKIKQNVVTLLSIPDAVGGNLEMLMDGGEVGLALWGLGEALKKFGLGAGINAAVDYFNEDWADGVKHSIETLLSIDFGNGVIEQTATILKGGALSAVLYALGQGLIVFGAGSGIAAAVDYFAKDDWADGVKKSVETLLSINLGTDTLGVAASLLKGGALTVVMGELGLGLAAFGAGSGVIAAVDMFAKDDWAENVKNNVATLLSISQIEGIFWDATKFAGVMGLIGAGLAAFAIGKTAEGASEGMQEAIGLFTQQGFAERIKSEVETLLSISQLDGVGADTAQFIATMGGIGLGLAAFALGKGAEGVTEGADKAIAYFSEDQGFADRIKTQVMTLLSIPGLVPEGSVTDFLTTMTDISLGLMAFAGGELVGTLTEAGVAILRFFDVDSPMDKILSLAKEADQLEKGASALEKIARSLEVFSNINIGRNRVDFAGLAEDLGKAIPLLDALANGGPVVGSEGWFSGPLVFPKGILDPSLKLDEMASAIAKVNYVLGQSTIYPIEATGVAEARVNRMETNATTAATTANNINAPTVNNNGGNTTNNTTSTTTIIQTNPHTSVSAYMPQ